MRMLNGLSLCAALLAGAVAASESSAPYSGQEGRDIASLSEADLADIAAGRGWGLAKPAELNGWPGPRHALDLREELGLDPAQVAAIEAIFERMQAAAIAAGADYVEAERALDAAFAAGAANADEVSALAAAAGAAEARLRAVHLVAHLETRPFLSDHQTRRYAQLRGYAGDGVGRHGGHGHGD